MPKITLGWFLRLEWPGIAIMLYWYFLASASPNGIPIGAALVCLCLGPLFYQMYLATGWRAMRSVLAKRGRIPQLELHRKMVRDMGVEDAEYSSWLFSRQCIRRFLENQRKAEKHREEVASLFLENSLVHVTAMSFWLSGVMFLITLFTRKVWSIPHLGLALVAFVALLSYLWHEKQADTREAQILQASIDTYRSYLRDEIGMTDSPADER
jgi:hypothetical protein